MKYTYPIKKFCRNFVTLQSLDKNEDAIILPGVLSAILAFIILSGAVLTVIQSNLGIVSRNIQSQQAFNIAEAGANYYLWHLSHSPSDFKDGQTTPTTPDPSLGYGPYVHTYTDDNSKQPGTYTLWIKPDGPGSTIVTVRSIGQVSNTNVIRTVETRIGAASFASFGLVSDSAFWFGETESANGPVHSNLGVRMDGASSGDVTSANSTYVVPFGLGGDGSTSKPGVWCDTSITTPVNCNTRSKSDWRYPTPLVDFNQISGSLCTIKKLAFAADPATSALASQANACSQVPTTRTNAYLPQRSAAGTYNIATGYLIELNPNGTYNLFNVNAENDQAADYGSALTKTSVANNISPPASGVIFAEDNVWVRSNPTYSGRLTIGAGRLASATVAANIEIADDLLYGNKNGSDALGLIAEDSIEIAPYAPPATGSFNFEVNGAMISQTGKIQYPRNYRTNSTKCTNGWVNSNQKFIFYGAIATRGVWTWTHAVGANCGDSVNSGTDGYISGVYHNDTQYDYNLMYAPPPSFPITSGYNILSWREVLTKP